MRRLIIPVLVLFITLAAIFAGGNLNAYKVGNGPERILDFKSSIRVDPDASINVTETITVLCRGEEIRRGIYRDFPLDYPAKYGLKKRVPFEIISVTRDGLPEVYRTTEESGSVRIYIGKSDYFLTVDRVYTFTITYRTSGLLEYGNDYASIYWNATGNFWSFVIDMAEATVQVPGDKIISSDAYTGVFGAADKNFIMKQTAKNRMVFKTTAPLPSGSGLTVRVNFPKEQVAAVKVEEERMQIVAANSGTLILVAGTLFILLYYFIAWLLVGRDPAKGRISMKMQPPENLSPAAVRYISRMGFDTRTVAAGILSLAVKGAVTLSEEADNMVLKKTNEAKDLTPDESELLSAFFPLGDTLTLDRSHSGGISMAMNNLNKNLAKSYQKVYFISNTRYFVPGILMTLGIIAGSIWADARQGMDPSTFLLLWLSMWTFGTGALLYAVFKTWRESLRTGGKGRGAAVFLSLFSIPFVVAELVVLGIYLSIGTPVMLLLSMLLIVINPVFFRLLKAPTVKGRAVMDHIEGFKQYLDASEKQKSPMHLSGLSSETFEQNLAYAVALDVENSWTGAFDGVLSQGSSSGRGYSPRWYTGTSYRSLGTAALMAGIGASLSTALSSSTSSSSSSGGSSGGGGGGGGGGGW